MRMSWIRNCVRSVVFLSAMSATCGSGSFGVLSVVAAEALSPSGILKSTGVHGGLVVHLGCGDGKTTASLLSGDGFLVQGLDTSGENVAAARGHIRSLGHGGKISIEFFDGKRLPYAGDIVNLMLVESGLHVSTEEISRVLSPRGIVLFRDSAPSFPGWTKPTVEGWTAYCKPVPDDIDEWTHYYQGPNNNPAANDTRVGFPLHLQWDAEPDWAHHHQATRGIESMVSAKGRLFYLVSEGEASMGDTLPERWVLVARDAFNGVILWKKAVDSFDYGEMWSADVQAGVERYPKQRKRQKRRLIAIGDRVYFTFGQDAPVSIVDAATGKTLKVLEHTQHCGEIVYFGDRLFVTIRDTTEPESKNSIRALDPSTGNVLWESEKYKGFPGYHPQHDNLTMTLGEDRLFFLDEDGMVCLALETGKQLWKSEFFANPNDAADKYSAMAMRLTAMSKSPSGLIFHDGKVFLLSQFTNPCLSAVDARTGKTLWQTHREPVSCGTASMMFAAQDQLWVLDGPTKLCGLDFKTGENRTQYDVTRAYQAVGGHIRCYPDKGSANTVWTTVGGKAQQMIDLRDGRIHSMPWLRSGCRIGPVLCNGLSYITPNPCMCYAPVRLKGLLALSPVKNGPSRTPDDTRLTRGPAYERTYAQPVEAEGWPTFRHDPTRESKASTEIPDRLKMAWETTLNGKLTQPVVAGGLAYIASTDEHTMYALDAKTGKQAWAFTVGGRIDSSPTWDRGRLLFGSADGAVYCLDAKQGTLAWRFEAAPAKSRIVSYNQVESLWPVHGTVLVNDDKAIVISGRTPYLDGGIVIYELNVADGNVLRKKMIDMTGTAFPEEPPQGFLPDILVQKDSRVYSRYTEIMLNRPELDYVRNDKRELVGVGKAMPYHRNRQFIVGSGGLLRDGIFHRSGMLYGTSHGQFMAVDETSYRVKFFGSWTRQNARPFSPGKDKIELIADDPVSAESHWTVDLPIVARSIVALDDRLVLAGAPCVVVPEDPWKHFDGRGEGRLEIRSRLDGSLLTQYKLSATPVHDGVSAANKALFISMKNGTVQCWR
jgi:outer membrane protein assembly factor BamB